MKTRQNRTKYFDCDGYLEKISVEFKQNKDGEWQKRLVVTDLHLEFPSLKTKAKMSPWVDAMGIIIVQSPNNKRNHYSHWGNYDPDIRLPVPVETIFRITV